MIEKRFMRIFFENIKYVDQTRISCEKLDFQNHKKLHIYSVLFLAMVKLHVINRLKPLCLFYQNIKFLWTLECSALMKNSTKFENKIIWMLKLIYYRESKYFTWRKSWKFTTVNNILHSKYLIIKLRRIFYQRTLACVVRDFIWIRR